MRVLQGNQQNKHMKKRHSAEQIIRILGEIENSGLKVSDACRPHDISEQTYFRWKKKYGGMDVSEATRLKALDIQIVKEVNSKKWCAPCRRKPSSRHW